MKLQLLLGANGVIHRTCLTDEPLPDGWVEAADEVVLGDMSEFLRYVDGEVVSTGKPVAPPFQGAVWSDELLDWTDARSLEEVKVACRAELDEAAGEIRRLYITISPGQEATYVEKAKQAEAFMADTAQSPDLFPLLKYEAEALGVSLTDLCTLVLGNQAAWAEVGGRIEATRVGGKAVITAATTADQAKDALQYALNALDLLRP